jgi:hypothetical protein
VKWLSGSEKVRKTPFLSNFYIKTIILPRQAWDKHRKNSKTDAVFRTSSEKVPFHAEVPGWAVRFLCILIHATFKRVLVLLSEPVFVFLSVV